MYKIKIEIGIRELPNHYNVGYLFYRFSKSSDVYLLEYLDLSILSDVRLAEIFKTGLAKLAERENVPYEGLEHVYVSNTMNQWTADVLHKVIRSMAPAV